MSDEPALLAVILAHPDEDTPRLIYADWLDENARPERAEFIRIQCAPDADEVQEACAFELEERNRGKWLAGFGVPQFAETRWKFRRGFPECLHAPGELFLERYAAFARVPWLQALWLGELSPWDLRDFANQLWPPQWIELTFSMVGSSDQTLKNGPAFAAFAGCAQLSQLRWLTLFRSDLDTDCVRAIAGSQPLENLQRFRLLDHRSDRGTDVLLAPLRERFGDRLVIG